MKLFTAIVFSILGSSAFASAGSEGVGGSTELIVIKSVVCASGETHLDKTILTPGKMTSLPGLKSFLELKGSVLTVNGNDVVLALPVSGNFDGVCSNGDVGTILIISASR
jgi:hypothetical protein